MTKNELVVKAREVCNSVQKNLSEVSADDAALCSLSLGVASWCLFAGLGATGPLGVLALVAGSGAVVSGFRGKDSEKDSLRKSAIAGTAIGTISAVGWLVAKFR